MYIMLNSVIAAAFGFFFWITAAKVYPKDDIGVATALISSVNLVLLLSRMGLDNSMIKFMPKGDRNRILGTTWTVGVVCALALGAAYIAGVDCLTPGLSVIKEPLPAFLFLGCVFALSSCSSLSTGFLALREGKYYLWQGIILGLRIPILFLFASLGAMGILSSLGAAYILATLFLLWATLRSGIRPRIKIDTPYLKKSFRFSAANYLSAILLSAPTYILPIMVLEILGAEAAAYYYIAYTIASLLFIIPSSFGTSMFVEGSHGEQVKKTTIKALKTISAILIPGIIALYFAGGPILHLIGKDYAANAGNLIKIFALSSVFVTANSIYFSIKKIQGDVKDLIYLSGAIAILLPATGYCLMKQYGIDGIGYAWTISYAAVALIIAYKVKKNGWI